MSLTPDQIAEMNPSDLAPIIGALLSQLERVKLSDDQKAALDAAGAVDANNRPLILGDAGDLTAAQLAAVLAGGGDPGLVGEFQWAGIGVGVGTQATIEVDGTTYATLAFSLVDGTTTARTGDKAATVDVGGGNGNEKATFFRELKLALEALAPDKQPFWVEPTVNGVKIVAPWAASLVLASTDAGLTAVNPT
ncbi:MAG: hypothetical protein KC613_06645 [Myxococcales bacterium]|nr:hypothetical protein [Myxococcales bacterium]